jgi:hypothetical protein
VTAARRIPTAAPWAVWCLAAALSLSYTAALAQAGKVAAAVPSTAKGVKTVRTAG